MTARSACCSISIISLASTDIDLEHRVANFLHQQHVPDGDCIRLDARSGVVVMRGELPSSHAKWLCIECCRRVAGVVKIVDELNVGQSAFKLPPSNKTTALFHSYTHGDPHDMDCHAGRLFDTVPVNSPAARGTVEDSERSKLLAAA